MWILLLIALAAADTEPDKKNIECGPNEVYRECAGCEGTCETPNPICPRICHPPSCQCVDGYVRHNGNCIPVKECPKKDECGPNEVYRECASCEGTCETPNPACPRICHPASCQCIDGYVRHNGNCILVKECPKKDEDKKKCGPNETFMECRGCEGTCEKPNAICTLQCRPAGCQCNKGYVRHNGNCIPVKECPKKDEDKKKCGPNETFMECRGCEGTCEKPNAICTLQCRPAGCQCNKGYVRHDGKCIDIKQCPKNKPEKPKWKHPVFVYRPPIIVQKPVYMRSRRPWKTYFGSTRYYHRRPYEHFYDTREYVPEPKLKIIERHMPHYTVKTKVAAPVYILPKHGPVYQNKYEHSHHKGRKH